MNYDKSLQMQSIAHHLDAVEKLLDDAAPEPRLAAIAKTQLEIAAAMVNKAIAFGTLEG